MRLLRAALASRLCKPAASRLTSCHETVEMPYTRRLSGRECLYRRNTCASADEPLLYSQPPRKSLKNPKIVKVSKQKTQNNGDIDIIPSKRITTNSVHVPEELISQGIRYQVPEQIVILDFWSRVKRDKYGMSVVLMLNPLPHLADIQARLTGHSSASTEIRPLCRTCSTFPTLPRSLRWSRARSEI